MKFPNHILLDFSDAKLNSSTQYWVFSYLTSFKKNPVFFDDLSFQKKYLLKKESVNLTKLMKSQKLFTIRYSRANPSLFLSKETISSFSSLFKPRIKVKHRILYSNYEGKLV
jgi:hypothetical protein